MAESTFTDPAVASAVEISHTQATSPSEEKASMSGPSTSGITMRDIISSYTSSIAEEPESDVSGSASVDMAPVLSETSQSAFVTGEVTADATDSELAESISGSSTGSDLLVNPENPENQFHLFPKLPIEIRLMIWRETMPPSRIFEMKICRENYTPIKITKMGGKGYLCKRYCRCSIDAVAVPTLLEICREARSEGLRFYKLASVGCSTRRCDEWRRSQRFVRVDFSRDYFSCISPFNRHVMYKVWDLVERLVIGESCWHSLKEPFRCLKRFRNLKELTILATNYLYHDHWRGKSRIRIPYDSYYDEEESEEEYEYDDEEESDDGEEDKDEPDDRQLIPIASNDYTYFRMDRGEQILNAFNQREREHPNEKLPVLKFARMEYIDGAFEDGEEDDEW